MILMTLQMFLRSVDWWSIVVIGLSFMACIYDLAYVFTHQRRAAKNIYRIATAVLWWYVILIYATSILNPNIVLIKNGTLSRIGWILMIAIHLLDVRADWRIYDPKFYWHSIDSMLNEHRKENQ